METIKDMVGKTIVGFTRTLDELVFTAKTGEKYRFYHDQNCSEDVHIEDIVGNLEDLLHSPLTMAEETINQPEDDGGYLTQTWTFYRFATVNGYVTIRWLGESNGYYSERVDFVVIRD